MSDLIELWLVAASIAALADTVLVYISLVIAAVGWWWP